MVMGRRRSVGTVAVLAALLVACPGPGADKGSEPPPPTPPTPPEPTIEHLDARHLTLHSTSVAACPAPVAPWALGQRIEGGDEVFCTYDLPSEAAWRAPFDRMRDASFRRMTAPDGFTMVYDRQIVQPQATVDAQATGAALLSQSAFYVGVPAWKAAPKVARKVTLAVLDSAATGEVAGWPSGNVGGGHGDALVRAASRLAVTGGEPLFRVVSRQVMQATGIVRGDGPKIVVETGTIRDLAVALYDLGNGWRPDRGELVVNLSLGWHPSFGPDADGVNADDPDVRLVRRALGLLRCRGAVVFAAVGNLSAGAAATQTAPIYPAAWAGDDLGALADCAKAFPRMEGAFAAAPVDTLVVPVGGLGPANDAQGQPAKDAGGALVWSALATTRPDSRPPLNAYAFFGATATAPGSAEPALPLLSGTSFATAAASASGAIALALDDLRPADLPRALYSLSAPLSDTFPDARLAGTFAARTDRIVGVKDAPARALRICDVLARRGATCPPAAAVARPTLVGDLPAETPLRLIEGTPGLCDGRKLAVPDDGSPVVAEKVCPSLVIGSISTSGGVFGAPDHPDCPYCDFNLADGVVTLGGMAGVKASAMTISVIGTTGRFEHVVPAKAYGQSTPGDIVLKLPQGFNPGIGKVMSAYLTVVIENTSFLYELNVRRD